MWAVLSTHHPKSTHLGKPVEGHPWEEDVRKELHHWEHGEHNPVGQPASVILFHVRFQCLRIQALIPNCTTTKATLKNIVKTNYYGKQTNPKIILKIVCYI